MFPLLFLALLSVPENDGEVDLHSLEEVVVESDNPGGKRSVKGVTATIDEHLAQLSHVGLVRRGSYAWEPMVNNMPSERLSTTIDGMKIFYACTDKMDPVTSYVESNNLQSISLNSGLDGNPQATGNIGGSLDLKLRKVGFEGDAFGANTSVGYEWNGHYQIYGADLATSHERFYANGGAFYRRADNYRTGHGDVLPFSQFHKVNAFVNVGQRLVGRDAIEATYIFDRATDVGYPALNMDVAKAEAQIASLSYKHFFAYKRLYSWETKAYFNTITHIMDDTQRPDVEIHMDMPGKSRTVGVYSLLLGTSDKHQWSLNADAYYNRLFADMTMYPGGAAPMYMVTWPDVGTLNAGLSLADEYSLPHHQRLHFSVKWAWQQQRIHDEEGLHALNVFFPGMQYHYYQVIGRVAARYQVAWDKGQCSFGAGWGSRAPTVTEAYGYYLNNTFDQYDYIGNPHLRNESAVELNAALQWTPTERLSLGADGNVFFFSHYIIGQFEPRLSAMTVGAEGVKVYGNIRRATIANTTFSAQWQALQDLSLRVALSGGLGRDAADDNLPLIAPWGYVFDAVYLRDVLELRATVKGNARQTHFGAKYGETETPSYNVVGLSAQYHFRHFTLRTGIENLFDQYYSTYADWRDIPQKGRNGYASLSIKF
ncbi:MAG: hypothetical protein J6Y99_06275 [Bacteroidales bacterium]|nr:hypothetical protein [Bacteroidales bacterium]